MSSVLSKTTYCILEISIMLRLIISFMSLGLATIISASRFSNLARSEMLIPTKMAVTFNLPDYTSTL